MIARHIMIPVGQGKHDPELRRWTDSVAVLFEQCVRARGIDDPHTQRLYSMFIHVAGDHVFDACGRREPCWSRLEPAAMFDVMARSPTFDEQSVALSAGILLDFYAFLVDSGRLHEQRANGIMRSLYERLEGALRSLPAGGDGGAKPPTKARRRAVCSARWLN